MENIEDLELIERYFRKELNPDESARFNERLADPAFKRKFETEKLVHKALQFSRERERVKSYSLSQATVTASALQWLDNKAVIMVGGAALAVWIFSTFSHSLTNLTPEYIKWVGLTVAVAGSILLLGLKNKTMNVRLGTTGLFYGLLVFVTASGIDAINQGTEGKDANEALLVPYTGNKAWWPTQSLEDSVAMHRKKILAMGEHIRTLLASRLQAGPHLNFGFAPKFTTVVVPRSSSVISGATYEADVYLGTTPLRQTLEMRVDGKSIPMEADPSGVQKGKVSFTASADQFDTDGTARKKFVAEIKLGDSTYTKVVEYSVVKSK